MFNWRMWLFSSAVTNLCVFTRPEVYNMTNGRLSSDVTEYTDTANTGVERLIAKSEQNEFLPEKSNKTPFEF